MSSILKALKKLEEEKTLPQETAAMNVARDILRKQPAGRNMTLWLWLTILVALAVIATLTALLLAKPARQTTSAPAQDAPAPAAETIAPPAAGNTVSLPPPETANRVITAPRPATTGQRLPADSLPLPSPATASSTTELPTSAATPPAPPRAEPGRKPPQRPAEPTEPALTLSGIAWNKDSADRLAIINGQPTATGATVSGVVVEEILPDRVKVNSAGRSFEIFLGNTAKTN